MRERALNEYEAVMLTPAFGMPEAGPAVKSFRCQWISSAMQPKTGEVPRGKMSRLGLATIS